MKRMTLLQHYDTPLAYSFREMHIMIAFRASTKANMAKTSRATTLQRLMNDELHTRFSLLDYVIIIWMKNV